MAIVFCHKERGISVEEENHLVTVGIVKKSKTILVLLASPIVFRKVNSEVNALQCGIRSPSHSCVIATLPVLWLNHGIA